MADLYQVRNGVAVPLALGGGDSKQLAERVDALETRVDAVEARGSVSLSDAVDSDSSATAASSKAVKTAYGKAAAAQTTADAAAGKADQALGGLVNATNAAVGLVRGDGVTTTVSNGAMSVIASVEATANSIVKRDASGNIVGNITGHATWAALAEVYRADGPLEEGDVVRVSPDDGSDVARAVPGSPVLGVVSLRPGVLLNCGAKDEPLHYAVARVGMVPVRVSGPVAKGARLTAGEDGKAVASPDGTGFAFANETKRDGAERLVMCIL